MKTITKKLSLGLLVASFVLTGFSSVSAQVYDTGSTYPTYDTGTTYPTYTTGTTYPTYNTGTTYPTYDTGTTYPTYTTGTTYPTYTTGTTYPTGPTYPTYTTGTTYGTSVTYPTYTDTTGITYPTGSTYGTGVTYPINTTTGGTVVTTINCPNGSVLTNGQCLNTITGTVITTTSCPVGTTISGTNCLNTVNGTVVTTIVCPTGTTLNGSSCVNTVTPPVTTVTNCPSNTQYINGICQQIINPPVVSYQTCWDGSVIPSSSICQAQYKVCANGTSVPVNQACYYTSTPVYVAPQVIKFNNVVTSIATQITNTSGRCNGIGLIANGAPSTAWFEYGETSNLGRTTASANIGSLHTSPFSNVLIGLKPSTKYYCRAVMQNQYGIVKGEIVSFVTKSSVTKYVQPVIKKTIKTAVAKKNAIVCSDGSTVSVKNESASTLINKGTKLVTLQIEKMDGTLSSGQTVHYKVLYKNISETRLTGVVVKVNLPQEVMFVSASSGTYDETSRVLTLNQDTIDPYTEGSIIVTGNIVKDAPLGKTVVTNVYAAYTVPGTNAQDEVTAYVVGSIVPSTNITKQDTGVKKVVGVSNGNSFMPTNLIEWLALIAICFIIFILGRSIYASYKDDEPVAHHGDAHH